MQPVFSSRLAGLHAMRRTVAEVDLNAIRYNRDALQKCAQNARVCLVVKADAYGHGMVEVAKACGGELFAVAIVEEAVALRQAQVGGTILVFGPTDNAEQDIIRHKLTPVVSDLAAAEKLNQAARQSNRMLSVHIEVDTGMSRAGIRWDMADALAEQISTMDALKVEGLMMHFSSVGTDDERTRLQIDRFNACAASLQRKFSSLKVLHAAASGALAHYPETQHDWVRPGIALYGVTPTNDYPVQLKPAMRWSTQIVSIRSIGPSDWVGYDHTFIAPRPSVIATLPLGYADGYPRLCSNRAEVLIRETRCKVVGRVSMDLVTVDVTDLAKEADVKAGEPVVLLGAMGTQAITASELAKWAETNPYEILTHISYRVPRLYRNV